MTARDERYRNLLLSPLRTCASYTPKFGKGQEAGLSLSGFVAEYGSDPLYSWMGLNSEFLYAAHKAAGGMTSVYRQLGIGCERLWRAILMDEFGLTAGQATWDYERSASGRGVGNQKLSLDGRVDLAHVADSRSAERIRVWLTQAADSLDIEVPLKGIVFEVRQGYKSKDSKRQNADLANASVALAHRYLPTLVIFSMQLDSDIRTRYQAGNWAVLAGATGTEDTQASTFAFSRLVMGFDLERFFRDNSDVFRSEVTTILRALLEPK